MAASESSAALDRPDGLRHQHLLDLSPYEADEIQYLLDTAQEFREVLDRPIRQVPTLQGTSVASLFFEPSTRTKLSFNLAAGRLSAETVSLSKASSSVTKGETLKDTARNVEAMKVDVVVLRHPSPAFRMTLSVQRARKWGAPGDGWRSTTTSTFMAATLRGGSFSASPFVSGELGFERV